MKRLRVAVYFVLSFAARLLGGQSAAPIAARDIARGIELSAADITGDSVSVASRVGWVSRRVIHAGEKLGEPAVAPAQAVRMGAAITVRFEANGIVVTRPGTALSSGSVGDHIRVRIDPQHIVTGIVASPATVKIQ